MRPAPIHPIGLRLWSIPALSRPWIGVRLEAVPPKRIQGEMGPDPRWAISSDPTRCVPVRLRDLFGVVHRGPRYRPYPKGPSTVDRRLCTRPRVVVRLRRLRWDIFGRDLIISLTLIRRVQLPTVRCRLYKSLIIPRVVMKWMR